MTKLEIKKQIIQIAKILDRKNLNAAADGNISYRFSDEEIFITPSGIAKALISEDDIAIINSKGEILQGQPSSEKLMHLTVYQHCPKAKAVIHAHPPTAIAWTIAFPDSCSLPNNAMSELILALGKLPIVPFQRPGTKAMGEVLIPYLPAQRAFILARHGALTWGEDLFEALRGIERIEHSAEILYKAKLLNKISTIEQAEVDYLIRQRKKIGETLL